MVDILVYQIVVGDCDQMVFVDIVQLVQQVGYFQCYGGFVGVGIVGKGYVQCWCFGGQFYLVVGLIDQQQGSGFVDVLFDWCKFDQCGIQFGQYVLYVVFGKVGGQIDMGGVGNVLYGENFMGKFVGGGGVLVVCKRLVSSVCFWVCVWYSF